MGGNSLGRYRIGLLVLGVFTFILLIMLAVQASSVKQDAVTTQKANQLATKLNNYSNGHSTVPASLDGLGVSDVPSTISYTKKSNTSYEFCVTYKQASTGSSINAASVATSLAFGGGLSSLGAASGSSSSLGSSYGSSGYLYLSPSHKKGQTCQTVTAYTPSSSLFSNPVSGSGSSSGSLFNSNGSSSYSDPYAACNYDSTKGDQGYNDYIACIDKVNGQQPQSTLN